MFYFISNTYTLEQSNTKRLSQGVLDESVQGGSSRRGGSSSSRRLSLGGRRRLLGFGGRGRQQLDLDGSSSSHQRRGGGFNLLGRLGSGSSGLIQPGVQFVHGVSGRWDCRGHRQVSSMTRSGRKAPNCLQNVSDQTRRCSRSRGCQVPRTDQAAEALTDP